MEHEFEAVDTEMLHRQPVEFAALRITPADQEGLPVAGEHAEGGGLIHQRNLTERAVPCPVVLVQDFNGSMLGA